MIRKSGSDNPLRSASGSDPWTDTIICPRCRKETPRRSERCQGCGYSIRETCAFEGPVTEATDVMIGRVINDKYRVVSVLGEGGFGVVYKVEFLLFDTCNIFALKLLHPALSQDPKFRRRFLREAALAMQLIHENTIQIREFGRTEDGSLFFTMDYCEGEPLNAVLARELFLSVNRALGIVLQMLAVMAQAHTRGIIHRDLKPENVFLERLRSGSQTRATQTERCPDFVKVGDFGLAKSYRDSGATTDITYGGILGTPRYMSPEQARGSDDLDHRSDLYSIGVMLHEMLFGQVPDDRPLGDGDSSTSYRPPPQPPQVVPQAVLQVLQRALAPRREDRFQSADEFASAIRALPNYTPSYEEPRPARSLVRARRSRSLGVAVALAVIVAGAAASAAFLADLWRTDPNGRKHPSSSGLGIDGRTSSGAPGSQLGGPVRGESRVSTFLPFVSGRQFVYDVYEIPETSEAAAGAAPKLPDSPTARLAYVILEEPKRGVFEVEVQSEPRALVGSGAETRRIRWVVDDTENVFAQEFFLPGASLGPPDRPVRKELFRLSSVSPRRGDYYWANSKVHWVRHDVRGLSDCLLVETVERGQRRLQYYREGRGLIALEVYELPPDIRSDLDRALASREAETALARPTNALGTDGARPAPSAAELPPNAPRAAAETEASPPSATLTTAVRSGAPEPDPLYAEYFLDSNLSNRGRLVYARYLTASSAPTGSAQ